MFPLIRFSLTAQAIDIESLAAAEDARLLKAWEGLGYYRRVRMLRETARAVIAEHGGAFPTDLAALMKLPGVGRYTAGALRAFAYDLPAAVVDGNVARVLSRVMDFSAPVDDTAGQKQMWEWAEALADPQRSRIYNSALMELGLILFLITFIVLVASKILLAQLAKSAGKKG